MPSAVYVPSKWNDLSTDVNVGTPAQGTVAYFGGSFWNSLPPGPAGQVLTSGGAGANPSWTTVAGGGAFVSLAPATVDQNLIQPAADTDHALVLKNHSATQSANPLEHRLFDGTLAAGISPLGAGTFQFGTFVGDNPATVAPIVTGAFNNASLILSSIDRGGGGTAGLVMAAQVSASPNSFYGFGETDYVLVNTGAATPVANMFTQGAEGSYDNAGTLSGWDYYLVNNGGGHFRCALNVTGSAEQIVIGDFATAGSDPGEIVTRSKSASHPALAVVGPASLTADLLRCYVGDTLSSLTDLRYQITAAGDVTVPRMTSVAARAAFTQVTTLPVATDATYTSRTVLSGVDHGGTREGLRIEGTGSAAAIGFLGAAASPRITLPAAAVDAGTTLALANALRSLAIAFGLGI